MFELCKQQIRVGLLRAARVLLKHQTILRKILTQCLLPELQHQEAEPTHSGSDDELSTDTETPPNMILQQLMMAATQPSPLKALFTREELEVKLFIIGLSRIKY